MRRLKTEFGIVELDNPIVGISYNRPSKHCLVGNLQDPERNVHRYEKPRNAIAVHCRVDGALKQGVIDSLGREKDTTFINEAGQVEKISTRCNFFY